MLEALISETGLDLVTEKYQAREEIAYDYAGIL